MLHQPRVHLLSYYDQPEHKITPKDIFSRFWYYLRIISFAHIYSFKCAKESCCFFFLNSHWLCIYIKNERHTMAVKYSNSNSKKKIVNTNNKCDKMCAHFAFYVSNQNKTKIIHICILRH